MDRLRTSPQWPDGSSIRSRQEEHNEGEEYYSGLHGGGSCYVRVVLFVRIGLPGLDQEGRKTPQCDGKPEGWGLSFKRFSRVEWGVIRRGISCSVCG